MAYQGSPYGGQPPVQYPQPYPPHQPSGSGYGVQLGPAPGGPPPGQYDPRGQPYMASPNNYGSPPPPVSGPGPFGAAAPVPYGYPSQGQYPGQSQSPGGGTVPGPYEQPPAGAYDALVSGPYNASSARAPYGTPPIGAPSVHSPYPQQPQASPYPTPGGPYPPGLPQQPYPNAAPPYAQPGPPSLGYVPGQMVPGDASHDAEILHRAMKGFATDERAVIGVLSKKDPLQVALLKDTFHRHYGKTLQSLLESETSGYFRDCLVALVRGPLSQDVYNAYRAVDGLGTKETLLNDVVLSRSNADLKAIKHEYTRVYRRSLEKDVRDDLSMKTGKLFDFVLAAQRTEESAPILGSQIDHHVTELYRATQGRAGTDQLAVCQIFASRSEGQLRTIAQGYEKRYGSSLEQVVEKEFSGHMRDALLMILRGATDRAMRDAVLLEETMRGIGTKDDLLLNRVVRYHWDRQHMNQVKGAYRHRYKRELANRIQGDTRGNFERVLLACIE